jgi:Family of unknown function (DUF6600)
MKSRKRFGWVLAALVVFSLASGLLAQDQNTDPNPGDDPPARVARIQYISGEVSMQPGGVNDWVAASMNRPLTTSDRVWTDKNSRTELNVGNAFIRMDSESSLTLTNVSDNSLQLELDQGRLELTVSHLEPGEIFEIDTPNLAFTVMKSGVYRIDVPPNDNQTWVTVRKGNGQATGQGPAVKVTSGEQVRFTGQGSLQHTAYAAPAPDGFEDWAQVRDKRLDGSVSARYVAPGVIGYQDLDYYGTWQVVPTYGALWVPAGLSAGWAPYRYGHWVWINPWGWTWVDDAAWGFAPFHYGRWIRYGGHWGWAPGPAYVGWRPYYAPALVGWIGGAGWGVGISIGFGGGCGWFPLGWGEAYYPWYHGYRGGHVSQAYVRNVNVTNTYIRNVNTVTDNYRHNAVRGEHYANRMVAGGVTAAPASALANGQNIGRVGRTVSQSELSRGQVVRNIDVSPTRQAVLGGSAARTAGIPPRSAIDRPVVTRNAPLTQPTTRTAEAQTVPRSTEARNVPAAPATLGVRSPDSTGVNPGRSGAQSSHRDGTLSTEADARYPNQAGSQHVVPRPPSAGGQAPRADRAPAATTPYVPNGGAQPAARNDAPRPPYRGGHAAGSVNATERGSSSASQPQHAATTPRAATPPTQSSPAAVHGQRPSQNSRETSPKASPNPGTASVSAPRPPSGYTYQPATAYAGRSSSTTSSNGTSSYSGNTGYGRNARSSSPATTPYVPGGSYSASAPTYRSAPSYGGSAPSYSSAPSYGTHISAPATPRYSAPSSYSGGGYSGGGGGSYSGGGYSGGGGHASGGGGGARSNSSGGHGNRQR